jgi:hypothetical protein
MKCITTLLLLIITTLSYGQVEHPAFRLRLDHATCCEDLTVDLNRTFPFYTGQSEASQDCGHQLFLEDSFNRKLELRQQPGITAGMWVLSNMRDTSAWRPLHRIQSRLQVRPLDWLIFQHSFEVYSHDVPSNSWSADWGGFYAGSREAFLLLQRANFRLLAGRFAPVTGPHGVHSLLFSSRNTLDGYDLEFNLPLSWGDLWFSANHWQLDDQPVTFGNARRYLAGHRLGYTRTGSFSLALAELFLYGGVNAVPTASTLNPFLIYHSLQMNGFEGNTMYHISGWWRPWRGLLLTSELLLDDIQFDNDQPADREPAEWALALGLRAAPQSLPMVMALEYTRVAPRTYNAPLSYQRWQKQGQPLAHPNGSDFDRLSLQFSYNGWRYLQPALITAYRRTGEHGLFADWDTPWLDPVADDDYSESFPTGVVEKELSVTMQVTGHWRDCEFIVRGTSLSWRNYRHSPDNQDDLQIEFEINLFLEQLLNWEFTPLDL